MALRKPFPTLETFSMSSMTDVIFLLLIFFMVTSTIIFPAALEVNLPESSVQTTLKPSTEVYVDSLTNYYLVEDRNDSTGQLSKPVRMELEQIAAGLARIQQTDSLRPVALYADRNVKYDAVINVLDIAAKNNIRMVLATKAGASAGSLQEVTPQR